MRAEFDIDTTELEERVAHRVIKALKPLLCDRSEDDTLFTVKTLAQHLQVSEKWIYERVQFKEIPYYKIGANLRFKRVEVDRWLEDSCMTPAANPLSGGLKAIK